MNPQVREILDQAETQLRFGHVEEAVKLCKKGLNHDYKNFELCALLAMIESQRGNHGRAKVLFERARRSQPDDAKNLSNLGIALAQVGELDTAETRLREAIEQDPNFAAALSNLGSVLIRQGRQDDAIEILERALNLNPFFGDALFNLGLAYEAKGEFEIALEKYSSAMTLSPNSVAAQNRRHELLIRLGQN